MHDHTLVKVGPWRTAGQEVVGPEDVLAARFATRFTSNIGARF